MRLSGKVVLVVGASSGMGRQTALRAGAEGATVIVAARRKDDCEAVAARIVDGGGKAWALGMDGTDAASVAAGFAEIGARERRLDGAFNNLGATQGTGRVHEISDAQWAASLAVNLTAPFLLMKAEIAMMIDGGGPSGGGSKGGVIVNNSSTAGVRGTASMADYSAAKWGLIGLGQSAALEYGAEGIRVNTIAPGIIRTEKMQEIEGNMPALFDTLKGKIPGGRFGEMEEIASTVVWLLSDEARYVNGATLRVDGGYSAG